MPKCVPLSVVLDDGFQDGIQSHERIVIMGSPVITIDRMKEPERGISRMVQRLPLSLGKQIRKQAVLDIVGKGSQNGSGFLLTTGAQREPFQADHRVASPIREPVVSGDDRSGFIAGRLRKGMFLQAASGKHDELVGSQGEPSFEVILSAGVGLRQQLGDALRFQPRG